MTAEINWGAITVIACIWALAFFLVMLSYFDYKMKVELAKIRCKKETEKKEVDER